MTWANDDPEGFWRAAAGLVDWITPFEQVLDRSRDPLVGWFTGGEVNTAANCLDRHVAAGRGDMVALYHDSPVTESRAAITYAELLDRVARFAGALADLGVRKGDRVIIYMPMVAEAAVAMLACARLGAIHSVVFGGFASRELAARIDDARPRVILSASCGIEPGRVVPYKPLLDEAIAQADHKPDHVVILERPQARAALVEGRDLDWMELESRGIPVDPVPVASTDPLYILYTSGTTGQPKGIVRDNGGHMVALAWSMRNIYGVESGETFWAASDIGWVVGHSYIVYGPLLAGASSVMFEGKPVGTPDAATYWRLIDRYKVKVMFTAPTALRAIKQQDPDCNGLKNFDISALKALYVAGERGDPDTINWAHRHVGVPVIDHWWQTETGWPITANCLGLGLYPVKVGSPGRAVPGYRVEVVNESGVPQPPGTIGSIVVRLPLPPGCLPTLWGNDQAFIKKYLTDFPGYYKTGDAGYMDDEGYLFVMARTDDIINVAGHRLSTGALEEVIGSHPDVAECAVFGVTDSLKGQVPVGLLVLKAGVDRAEAEIVEEVIAQVRREIGPVAAFRKAAVVRRLPKTRSGKILRATMQAQANGQPYKIPATIDDPAILDEIRATLLALGFDGVLIPEG
ncbi:MAG: propionyl-CoA synthetase [Alphaproteobacteria bacterium]|nr:MAG: propionyl-CoA synthetase [Alphaproteobacteria bacterium]